MRTDQPPEMIVCPLTPLERAHHRQKLSGLAVVALLGLGVLRAATWRQESMPIEEARARRVLPADVEGNLWGYPSVQAGDTTRVEVADSADGCPGLSLYDQTGWPSQDWKQRRATDLT